MSSVNNNNKKEHIKDSKKNIDKCKKYPKKGFRDDFISFNMGIKDDISDPFKDDLLGLKSFEERIFKNFSDIFSPLESLNEKENKNEAEEKPKEIKEVEPPKEIEEKEKEDEIKTDTKKEIKEREEEEEEDINTNTNTKNENNGLSYISKE